MPEATIDTELYRKMYRKHPALNKADVTNTVSHICKFLLMKNEINLIMEPNAMPKE
jgi:hypothetical protein